MDDAAVRTEPRAHGRHAFVGFGLAVFAMWLLLHPYWGIAHDSILYTGAALARLHPETLAHDVFLRFGSQDQYTIFSPLYATAIRLLGLENAAALLTFCAQLAFFGSAWLLARRLMSAQLAWLSVGLLVVLPSGYGAYQIFRYTEDFLTPRELAESCVLAALSAALARRYVLAGVAILVGALLHPIMAAAGVAMMVTLQFAIPHPRRAIVLGVVAVAVFAGIVFLVPAGPFARIDDLWWSLLQDRSGFLFIERWTLADWARAAAPIAVLAVGGVLCREPVARAVCVAGLVIGACGVALTLVGSDALRIVIITQLQPWRWLWLSSVAAVLLIPAVARDGWQAGPLARTAVLLTATSWMFRAEASALLVAALALAAAVASTRTATVRRAQPMYLGALAIFAVGLLFNLANKWLATTIDPTFLELETKAPEVVQWLRLAGADGLVPAAVLLLVWIVAREWRSTAGVTLAILPALAACCAVLPVAWASWTAQKYSEQLHAAFAHWRELIPARAEVFWPDVPLGPWYLLDRAGYISTFQTAGLVFSRAAAVEMLDRTRRMKPLYAWGQFDQASREWAIKHHPPADLSAACRSSATDFVASSEDLKRAPIATMMPNAKRPNVRFRLYRCSDFRG